MAWWREKQSRVKMARMASSKQWLFSWHNQKYHQSAAKETMKTPAGICQRHLQ